VGNELESVGDRSGKNPGAMSKLGQLLVARGWITVQQLTRALKNQSVVGGRLGTCLLEMDALNEDLLLRGLAEQQGMPGAGVDDLRGIPEEVRDLLPARLAKRCRAVPFRLSGGALDVAMADVRNLGCQDEIAFATGKRVRVHVAVEIRLLEALEKYWDEECPARFAHLLDRMNRARFLWDREEAQPARPMIPPVSTSGSPSGVFDRLAPAVRLEPPPLPEPPLPPLPTVRPAPASVQPAAAPPAPLAPIVPRPAPPPPVRSIALTEEERDALARERRAAAPAPTTFAEAQAAFEATRDREEIGTILLGFLARHYRRVALFQVGRDRVTGWRAVGDGVVAEDFGRFTAAFDQPSIFLNLRQGSGLHLGPLAPMPVHRELARSWGGELPRECVMLPVRLRDRLVTVIYAERAEAGTGGLHLEELKRLTDQTAAAFERCILHKKQAGTGA
jgi:hypothetical protein